MSLVGFDHVFHDAVERELAPGLVAKVVPLVVLTLLKIVSYLDQPAVRQKDRDDIAAIVDVYGEDGERRFNDEVLDAGIDYSEAGPYLLGRDLFRLCTECDERDAVDRFLHAMSRRAKADRFESCLRSHRFEIVYEIGSSPGARADSETVGVGCSIARKETSNSLPVSPGRYYDERRLVAQPLSIPLSQARPSRGLTCGAPRGIDHVAKGVGRT